MKLIYSTLHFIVWLACRCVLGLVCTAAAIIALIPVLFISSVLEALNDAWADYNRRKP